MSENAKAIVKMNKVNEKGDGKKNGQKGKQETIETRQSMIALFVGLQS